MAKYDFNIENFKVTNGWCTRFMKRNNLSMRAVTSVGQSLPADWEEKKESFLLFIKDKKRDIDLKHLGNMDEVSVSFDIPDTRTVDEKGKKDILIKTTGNEKYNFTVILTVTADGKNVNQW